jgi:ribonucleotide reductase alpha subunit
MSLQQVKKRSGDLVAFDKQKITDAIFKAAESVGGTDVEQAARVTENVCNVLEQKFIDTNPSVEEIQNTVEKVLIETGHAKTAKAFILYRAEHDKARHGTTTSRSNSDDPEIDAMFAFKSKLYTLVPSKQVETYKRIFYNIRKWQDDGTVEINEKDEYLGKNELADSIYKKKYYLKNLAGECIEHRPEHVFGRLAAVLATIEETPEKQDKWAKRFYNILYKGYFVPGGRVIAGAGDLYRTKSLANCFVSVVQKDNIESIYQTAYECARTYSYGGGIGVDISSLRPKDSVVHNAADKSTGAVSFMELYSLTTGLIGQSGRRGALMLTIDVKHPDTIHFIDVKRNANWVTKQIIEQCKWSNQFNEKQLLEVEKQVKENTQVRFANISLKVSDEFMQAVDEETTLGKSKLIVYKKKNKEHVMSAPQTEQNHYSYNMPSKDITQYEEIKTAETLEEINAFLQSEGASQITAEQLADVEARDVFGDFVIQLEGKEYDFAVKYAGDYMLYFGSEQSGDIRNLVKARELWDKFVAGNYKTAEPGLIFWTTMTKYSPSNYVGRPIGSTNPCIVGSSLVATKKGLQRMENLVDNMPEVFTDNRVPIETNNGDGTISLMEQKQGVSFDTVSAVWSSGIKETYKLTTKKGYEFVATADHKIMTSTGFKPVSELTENDNILIQKGRGMWNTDITLPTQMSKEIKGDNNRIYPFTFPTTWSKELGQLLGWTIGDGFITAEPDNRLGLVFSNNDQEVLNILKSYLDEIYGRETKISVRETTKQLRYHSKFLCEFLRKLGVKSVKADYKTVPEAIFTGTEEAVVGFLQALFTADGTMAVGEKGNYVRLTSKSGQLLKEVQVLLLNMGMLSTIYERHRPAQTKFTYTTVKGEEKSYETDGKLWELSITKGSLRRFIEEIGFIGNKHKTRIEAFLQKNQYKEEFFDTIKSVKPQGQQEVYDLTEPRTHSFVANGIVISNCGEVPLEDGGACNLSSINLSRFVTEGYTPNAEINWDELRQVTKDCVRFLDNVITWNTALNPLEKQRKAAGITRRIGLGVIGITDMLNQLGVGYDSEEGMNILEKVMKEIANVSYGASAEIAEEKGSFPTFNYEDYSRCPFFTEALEPETQQIVKEKGLRNVAILSIAPTGTISNIVLGFVDKKTNKNYIGVSGGIEPIFSLYYTRRAESFGNRFFKVFHGTVQAYIEMKELAHKVEDARNMDELRKILPAHFFRTAHFLSPSARVKIQGIAQKYIDHSISSTVNLPESVDPETISNVYLDAWRQGLKGITIYRDGSRYPILSVDKQQTAFSEVKDQNFKVMVNKKEMYLKGDEVFALPGGKLSTPFHAMQLDIPGVMVAQIKKTDKESVVVVEKKAADSGDASKKVCEVKIENGKVVKTCSE